MDIAVESGQVARSTYLAAARRGAWIIPKYLLGRSLDQLVTNPAHAEPARLARLRAHPAHQHGSALRRSPATARRDHALAEAQGQWLADSLRGRYRVPRPGRWSPRRPPRRRADAQPYVASKRHTIQVDFDCDLYELRRERRRGAKRARAADFAQPVPARAAGAGEQAVAA